MPLTDIQVRNAKPGLKPARQSNKDEESTSPEQRKAKGKTAGKRTKSEAHDASQFIATEKPYKMADGGRLYLEVDPSAGKYWRFKYRRFKRENRISLGVYPDVSLTAVREEREKCRKQLAQGIDPGVARKAQKEARASGAANSFEVIAREWLKEYIDPKSESHRKLVYARIENDIFPFPGRPPHRGN